jgi:FdrA protein
VQDAGDPATAVLLFDVVLGFGASAEPVAELLPLLNTAQVQAGANGRHILFIAHVCGTELDPQSRETCVSELRGVGVLVADSNMEAAQLATLAILALKGKAA